MKVNRKLMREARAEKEKVNRESLCGTHEFLRCEKPNIFVGRNGPYADGVIQYYVCGKCGKIVGG